MSKEPKFLSNRISYLRHEGYTTVVVAGKIDKKKYYLLSFWLIAWLVVGALMIHSLLMPYTRDEKLIMVVFLFFWAYYTYRIGYVWMWRRKGRELIKLEEGVLNYKRAIGLRGKSYAFFFENIKDFGLREIKPGISSVLEDSFWVLGGERLSFDHQGREVKMGIQLSDKEATDLDKFLKEEMKLHLKREP